MKIALITDGIHPFVLGGMQKHSYYLAKNFAALGVFVTVYHCPNTQNPNYANVFTAQELLFLNFIEIEFPVELNKIPGHYVRASKNYSKAIYNHFMEHNEAYDFIYAKGFTARSLLKNKSEISCPIAVQLHGLEMFQKGGGAKQILEKELLKPITKNVLKAADHIFTYGGKIKEILLDNGIREEQIVLQHGAADEIWLQPMPKKTIEKNNFLFVGRFEFRKAHHIINAAIGNIKGDFVINMVGEVPEDQQLEHPKINYMGNKNPQEILELMAESTFLLIPSLAEGFPTIIVEAMAQGLIPLATKVGAVEEIVNHNNGLLFLPGDTEDLEKSIKKALSLPAEERARLSQNARKQVEINFNWHKTAQTLLKDIESCIDNWKRTYS